MWVCICVIQRVHRSDKAQLRNPCRGGNRGKGLPLNFVETFQLPGPLPGIFLILIVICAHTLRICAPILFSLLLVMYFRVRA